MDGGVAAWLRNVFRAISFIVFVVASAYLLLELVIALSAQGVDTGAVAPFNGAEVLYPIWYQAPEFLDAVWVAMVAYPAAAVFYGIALLARLAATANQSPRPRLPAASPESESLSGPDDAVAPAAAHVGDDVCIVSADRRIQHITPSTAQLFGLTPRAMRGQSLEVFLLPGDLPKLDALVAAAYADRPRAFATTVSILLAETDVAPVDITCSAGEDGLMSTPGSAILTIRPFSERGRLDDQLAALWY